MKRAITFFVFFLGSIHLGFSQEKANINHLTSGKWQVESMEIGEDKMVLARQTHWMEFQPDGRYKIVLDEKEQIGTWKMSNDQKQIKFDAENFAGESVIRKLTAREFLFSISEGDVVYTMVLKK